MLLEIVANARDVGRYFHAVGQADSGDLSDSGVRLFRSLGSNFGSYAALERRIIKYRSVLFGIKATCQSHGLRFPGGLVSFAPD